MLNKCMIAFLAVLLVASCKERTEKIIKPVEPISFNTEGLLHLFKSDGTKIKTIDIEIADTDYEKDVDLKNRPPLTDDQGVLFMYSLSELRGYYMTDIAFPLDIVFLGGDNRIVSFSENAKALDSKTFLPSQVPAMSVLKINGGLSEQWVLEVGDYVEIVKIEK